MSDLSFDWLLFAVMMAATLSGLIAGLLLRLSVRDGKSHIGRGAEAN
jgi:hypothetical protein